MAEADLPELKDCPKCSGGMKLCEFPFFLSLARSAKGSYHAADDRIAIYPYVPVLLLCRTVHKPERRNRTPEAASIP
jgi:hypothetical protein